MSSVNLYHSKAKLAVILQNELRTPTDARFSNAKTFYDAVVTFSRTVSTPVTINQLKNAFTRQFTELEDDPFGKIGNDVASVVCSYLEIEGFHSEFLTETAERLKSRLAGANTANRNKFRAFAKAPEQPHSSLASISLMIDPQRDEDSYDPSNPLGIFFNLKLGKSREWVQHSGQIIALKGAKIDIKFSRNETFDVSQRSIENWDLTTMSCGKSCGKTSISAFGQSPEFGVNLEAPENGILKGYLEPLVAEVKGFSKGDCIKAELTIALMGLEFAETQPEGNSVDDLVQENGSPLSSNARTRVLERLAAKAIFGDPREGGEVLLATHEIEFREK